MDKLTMLTVLFHNQIYYLLQIKVNICKIYCGVVKFRKLVDG